MRSCGPAILLLQFLNKTEHVVMSKIEITLNPTPSHLWAKSAEKRAREAAAAAGVEWIDADVLVILPEPGRCLTKSPGRTSLIANG